MMLLLTHSICFEEWRSSNISNPRKNNKHEKQLTEKTASSTFYIFLM